MLDKKELVKFGMVVDAMGGMDTTKTTVFGKNAKTISSCVEIGSEITKEHAINAVSICRRRFKEEDIIVLVILDDTETAESGIVFTEKGIYYWLEEKGFVAEIPYGSIDEVDFDEEHTIIRTTDDEKIKLLCRSDKHNKYSRYMYNYIMDLTEAFAEL